MSKTLRSVVSATVLLLAASCSGGGTGPLAAPYAGTYVLTSVSGRGAAAGSFTLSRAGGAERRVRFQQAGGLSPEYVARGTIQLRRDGTVDLQLREDDGRSPYVWRPITQLTAGELTIRYPDAGDGPDIVETYWRP